MVRLALSGAVWALMLTTCLTLDFARDRQDQQVDSNGGIQIRDNRSLGYNTDFFVTRVFWLFTSLALPGGLYRCPKSHKRSGALIGLLIGGLTSLHPDELSRRFRPGGKRSLIRCYHGAT